MAERIPLDPGEGPTLWLREAGGDTYRLVDSRGRGVFVSRDEILRAAEHVR